MCVVCVVLCVAGIRDGQSNEVSITEIPISGSLVVVVVVVAVVVILEILEKQALVVSEVAIGCSIAWLNRGTSPVLLTIVDITSVQVILLVSEVILH